MNRCYGSIPVRQSPAPREHSWARQYVSHLDCRAALKRLIETAADGEGKLSVLLAGHPKLRRDLRSPTMEEIGYRTTVFSL
jgi:hypothetical protein